LQHRTYFTLSGETTSQGFTRTELVGVLSIVAVVTALVLPAIATARKTGRAGDRSRLCLTNMERIGQAMALYLADNDGIYPPTGNPSRGQWLQIILPNPPNHAYSICPDATFPALFDQKREVNILTGYAYNITLRGHSSRGSEMRVRYPATTVVAFDARAGVFALSRPDVGNPWKNGTSAGLSQPPGIYEQIAALPDGARRHGGAANYLLADGHVRSLKPEQVGEATRGNDGKHPSFGM